LVCRNADAVVEDEHGRLTFVEPYEIDEDFAEFLEYVQRDSSSSASGTHQGNVKYAQTRESLRSPITIEMKRYKDD
jgi:jumonji domain-containing protein 7